MRITIMAECAPEEDKTERPQEEAAPEGKQENGAVRLCSK